MIAESFKGAHPERWLVPPSRGLVDGWSPTNGVAMVTLAPELPGALELVTELVGRGVVVSLGHTAATAAQVEAAVAAGATCMTHLFNAMPPLHHRAPGPAGVALTGSLVAGVLVDGHHLDSVTVRLAWGALGPSRFLTVTDTTAALGLGNGPQRLGDQDVVVADGVVRLADGTLAGSAASLPECLWRLVRTTGCTVEDALLTATRTPARLLRDQARGRLDTGARGDVTLLEPDGLGVVATVVGGRVLHDARGL
jgi:N-acetylglucosamine-6-phosphate deacetylase